MKELPEAARAFLDGDVALLPSALQPPEAEALIDEVAKNPRAIVAKVPGAHARRLIETAYQHSLAVGRTIPEQFAQARLELGPTEPPAGAHPALALAPPLPLKEARPQLRALHQRP